MLCSCGNDNPEHAARCLRCGRPLANPLDLRRLALDMAVGVGLVIALGAVWLVDRKSPPVPACLVRTSVIERPALKIDNHVTLRPSNSLRLAVTPPEYDDMGRLLATLGPGYQFVEIPLDALLDPQRLASFDVIFLTCGGVPDSWLGQRVGTAERGSVGAFRARREIADQLSSALRRFVARGGTLYASDWQIQLLEIAFPEFLDPSKRAKGAIQTVHAEVVDAGLARRLGPTIELRFDKTAWYSAAFRERDVVTYLRGTFLTLEGRRMTSPLLVKFPFHSGNVVFTSFHNEAQNTQTELELLRYLVFTAVTAREETKVQQIMVRGGFSPKERNLLSVSQQNRPVVQEYECRRRGPLQFALGFEEQGARLQLTVTEPNGTEHTQTGTKTFSIDIPDAQPGTWRYTITPLEIPYPNFPFTLLIGEKP